MRGCVDTFRIFLDGISLFQITMNLLNLNHTGEPDPDSEPDTSEIEPLRQVESGILTPPHSDITTPSEEKVDTLPVADKQGAISDDESGDKNKKSCLSLPVEPLNGCMLPIHQDRRKLSVQGLMGFADRRRSSGAFLSDLTRKLSITNSEGLGHRSPGGVGKKNRNNNKNNDNSRLLASNE